MFPGFTLNTNGVVLTKLLLKFLPQNNLSHCAWIFPFPSHGHQWKKLKQLLGPTGPDEPPLGPAGWRRRLPRVTSSPDSFVTGLRPVAALPGHTRGEQLPQEAAEASSLHPRSSWPRQLLQVFPGTVSNNLPPPQFQFHPVLDGAGSILSHSKSSLTQVGHQLNGCPQELLPEVLPALTRAMEHLIYPMTSQALQCCGFFGERALLMQHITFLCMNQLLCSLQIHQSRPDTRRKETCNLLSD